MSQPYRKSAVILTLVVIALVSIALLTRHPADGLTRFHDFIVKNKNFSVDLATTSDHVKSPGKGTYLVRGPNSFRLTMDWGTADYTYVKSATDAVEYEAASKTYMEYPGTAGLTVFPSVLSDIQSDSLPFPLLNGDLKPMALGVPYKLTGTENGIENYTATWNADQSKGTIVASIDAEGRLAKLDYAVSSPMGSVHRITSFTNYVMNPPIAADSFSTIPPMGFTVFQFPYPDLPIVVGRKLQLGSWKSAKGTVNIDSLVTGKFVIIRMPNSAPADGLMAYLAKHPLPVKSIVLSLGDTGGQYHSPPKVLIDNLSTAGTPLMILFGSDGKVKGKWMGFDADNPVDLAKEVSAALKENEG